MFDIEAEELGAFRDVHEEFLYELLACCHECVAGESLGKSLDL